MPRVAFIGSTRWLDSGQVRALEGDPRIVSTGRFAYDELPDVNRLGAGTEVALVQLDVRSGRGLDVLAAASVSLRTLRCIAVVSRDDEDSARACIEAEAWGTIVESSDVVQYRRAILAVTTGRLIYPPDILDRIETRGGHMRLIDRGEGALRRLTPIERRLLILLAGGMTAPQAATALSIPAADAHQLRAKLMRKLGVRNRADLVRLAIRTKLIEP